MPPRTRSVYVPIGAADERENYEDDDEASIRRVSVPLSNVENNEYYDDETESEYDDDVASSKASSLGDNFVSQCVGRLLEGEEGHEVMLAMRKYYTTTCSLEKHMSKVRQGVLRELTPELVHKEYGAAIRNFKRVLRSSGVSKACKEKADAFLAMDFRDQNMIIRKHKRRTFCFNDEDVDHAFRLIQVLPENMRTFVLDARDADACASRRSKAKLRKNEMRITLWNTAVLLDGVCAFLDACDTVSYREVASWPLVAALLLVSGRRITEICNGRSTFVPLKTHMVKKSKGVGGGGNENVYGCTFGGQLKKRRSLDNTGAEPYDIPLLVPFKVFMKGLELLRQKQDHVSVAHVLELTNEQVVTRYAVHTNRYIRETLIPGINRVHDLRAVYAIMVYNAFDIDPSISFNRLAMQILGHENIELSLHYNHIVIRDFDKYKRKLGPLPIEIQMTEVNTGSNIEM